jgi:hypothetical protein
MPRRKNILVSSSDGTDAKGAHIVTPNSVLSYVDATDEELKVHHTLAAGSISIKVNSIWSRDFMDITLPVRHIYDYVPINPVLIKRWLESTDVFPWKMAGHRLQGSKVYNLQKQSTAKHCEE